VHKNIVKLDPGEWLSQEGTFIAFFAMTRGVIPKRKCFGMRFYRGGCGTTPSTISTAVSIVLPLLTQEDSFASYKFTSFTAS